MKAGMSNELITINPTIKQAIDDGREVTYTTYEVHAPDPDTVELALRAEISMECSNREEERMDNFDSAMSQVLKALVSKKKAKKLMRHIRAVLEASDIVSSGDAWQVYIDHYISDIKEGKR